MGQDLERPYPWRATLAQVGELGAPPTIGSGNGPGRLSRAPNGRQANVANTRAIPRSCWRVSEEALTETAFTVIPPLVLRRSHQKTGAVGYMSAWMASHAAVPALVPGQSST